MTELLALTLACGALSLGLAISGRRVGGPVWPVAEAIMLAAMLDVHLPMLGVVPAPVWSLLLVGCAIGAAFSERLRRGREAHSSGDHLHAVGMILAAVLVLLIGAASGPEASVGASVAVPGHSHNAVVPLALVAATTIAVAGYAAGVVFATARRRPGRAEIVRRGASLAGLVAMAGMTAVAQIG